MSKFQRHSVVPLLLTCFLSGCYKWSAAVVRDEAPEQVRLMLSDGSRVKLRSPEVRGDSIVGWTKGASVDTLAAYSLADLAPIVLVRAASIRGRRWKPHADVLILSVAMANPYEVLREALSDKYEVLEVLGEGGMAGSTTTARQGTRRSRSWVRDSSYAGRSATN